MSSHDKKWFIITAGVASVHKDATFNSPCVTEAVHGESCTILDYQKDWIHLTCEDGYEGWCHSFFGDIQAERNNPTHRIVFPNELNQFDPKYPFGAMVIEEKPGSIPINESLDLNQIIPLAKNVYGVPYRWGGKTSLGFDCSGLVQSVLKACGIHAPRDAYQQADFFKEKRISMQDAEPGDLHFFGRDGTITHVGFSTGGAGLLHAQGYVKEESLSENSKLYNKNLADIYLSTQSIRCKFRP